MRFCFHKTDWSDCDRDGDAVDEAVGQWLEEDFFSVRHAEEREKRRTEATRRWWSFAAQCSLSSAPLSRAAPDTSEASETCEEGTVYMYVHVCVCMCVSTCSYSIMIKPAQIPARQFNCLAAFLWKLSSRLSCCLSLKVLLSFSTLTCLPVLFFSLRALSTPCLFFLSLLLPSSASTAFQHGSIPICRPFDRPSKAADGHQTLLLLIEYISCNILCRSQLSGCMHEPAKPKRLSVKTPERIWQYLQ